MKIYIVFAIGTAMFRAPELWETRHSPTQAADIWSVGLTLLRVMTSKCLDLYLFALQSFRESP